MLRTQVGNHATSPSFFSHHGLTLMEMIFALSLATMLGLVTFTSSLYFLNKFAVKHSAIKVISDIRTQQSLSGQNQNVRKIVFDVTQKTYTIYRADLSTNTWLLERQHTLEQSKVIIKSSSLIDGQLIFNADGVPFEGSLGDLPSASVDIKLLTAKEIVLSRGNQERAILISPETGTVQ